MCLLARGSQRPHSPLDFVVAAAELVKLAAQVVIVRLQRIEPLARWRRPLSTPATTPPSLVEVLVKLLLDPQQHVAVRL
eukprot:SAG11_NODE_13647_length_645_cov_1.316850_3_plen_78_part_01